MQVGLGPADVGPAHDQARRHTDGYARGNGRDRGAGDEFLRERQRRFAEQQRDRVDLLDLLLLELRQLRFDRLDLLCRTGRIESGDQSLLLLTHPDDVEDLLVDPMLARSIRMSSWVPRNCT